MTFDTASGVPAREAGYKSAVSAIAIGITRFSVIVDIHDEFTIAWQSGGRGTTWASPGGRGMSRCCPLALKVDAAYEEARCELRGQVAVCVCAMDGSVRLRCVNA